jgi:hypothetical protein
MAMINILCIAFLVLLAGALIVEADIFIKAHNKSVDEMIKISMKELDKTREVAEVFIDFKKAILAHSIVFKELSTEVRKSMQQTPTIQITSALKPTKEEVKKKNIQEYLNSLEYAKDTFTSSPTEKKVMEKMITRIKSTL